MARTRSSRRWLDAHRRDPYVLRAQQCQYRSRAAFKLLEIQQRDQILRPGQTVLDLGAAPGAWSQVAAAIIGPQGRLIAVDLLPMESLGGVEFIQGDVRDDRVRERLLQALAGRAAQLVISDMAPNLSGVAAIDLPRVMEICEVALALARETLAQGGDLLLKVFEGEGREELVGQLRATFRTVAVRKPRSSRTHSREYYLLARNHRL
jgi:23S rRNA (uridine2552-2'-O)-methyltransferase